MIFIFLTLTAVALLLLYSIATSLARISAYFAALYSFYMQFYQQQEGSSGQEHNDGE